MVDQVQIFSPKSTPSPPPAAPAAAAPAHVPSSTIVAKSDPPIAPWQQRWADDQAQLTRERPWADPNMLLRKQADGTITATPRTDANGAPSDAGNQRPQPGQPQPGEAKVADGKLVIGDFELSSEDVRGLMERKSLEDGRRAQMPATAGDYSLDLPKDFQLPPGTAEWKWDLENPTTAATLGAAKQLAAELGLDQPSFSRLLGLHVSHELATQQRLVAAQREQIAALGPAATARVDAVQVFLRSALGDADAKPLVANMYTAAQVQSYEKLIRHVVSQGVSGSPAGARDGGPHQAKLTEEQYAQLTYHQKLQYAEAYNQQGGR
jgi:hypothetical protein